MRLLYRKIPSVGEGVNCWERGGFGACSGRVGGVLEIVRPEGVAVWRDDCLKGDGLKLEGIKCHAGWRQGVCPSYEGLKK